MPGACSANDGKKTSGQVYLGDDYYTKEMCIIACKNQEKATGCEYRVTKKGCWYYTGQVKAAHGSHDYVCMALIQLQRTL